MRHRAGELDRKITIEQFIESQDDFGQPIKAWSTWQTPWAKVEVLNANENIDGAARSAVSNVRFTIRWRAGLHSKMRISYDGEIYNIRSVGEPDRRNTIVIEATTAEVQTGE